MILAFHVFPLARGQGLCDIVYVTCLCDIDSLWSRKNRKNIKSQMGKHKLSVFFHRARTYQFLIFF